jgi:hypothetical protein
LDLLPPRIASPELLGLLTDILALDRHQEDSALRMRLIAPGVSWQELVDLAVAQQIILPLIWSLSRRSLLLPVPVSHGSPDEHPTSRLQSLYRAHAERRAAQRAQLVEVISALNRAQAVPVLLKGARYLMTSDGSWCEARDMRDIDILIRQEDAPHAAASLQAIGYVFEPDAPPIDQHLPELSKSGCPSVVELHTEALSFSARPILSTDEVWRRGERRSADRLAFLVLPDEWQLLHALLNHQVSDRGHPRHLLALRPLWEFTMLGRGLGDEGWRSIADHMAARGRSDVLGSWVLQARQLFGLTHPGWLEIPTAAHVHARKTYALAQAPDWLRRTRFLVDRLRFGFARETLATRYRVGAADVSIATVGRHLLFLARRYRGQMLRHIIGRRDRPS